MRADSHAIAVLADVHFHDPEGDFGGAGLVINGTRLALRSWRDTRTAARAFNETATTLTAALEMTAAMGLRHVLLAGDYSDDGQAENIRRLAMLLQRFEQENGLQFYAIPGNHDLYGPYGKDVTTRFVSAEGQTVIVTSDPQQATTEATAVLTPAMRCAGQPAALLPMARFGLFRQPHYLHWESPFGQSDQPEARMYNATSADGSVTQRLMDASYLVEPEAGLWLLMLDANVFEPRAGRDDASRKKAFIGPSDAGWNAVLRVKPFLLSWIAKVTARAALLGKTLVTVSHYPVLDPFQDAAKSEQAMFGQTAITRRTPLPQVGRALIAAGLRWHVGGHMHVNATTRMAVGGNSLADLSLPSLATFPPAFKVIHARPDAVSAQTIPLDDVPPDTRISALYEAEGRHGVPLPLGKFLAAQRRAQVIERLLPHDWPPETLALIANKSTDDLLGRAHDGVAKFAQCHDVNAQALTACSLRDLITDAYLVKVAGPLARNWITPDRLTLYRVIATECGDSKADPTQGPYAFLARFLSMLHISLNRMDADDIQIMPALADLSPAVLPLYPSAD